MRFKLLLLVLCAFSLGSVMASDLDFTLVNATNRSFEAVYLSATSNKDWDGNLLAQGKALAAGGKLAVRFDGAPKSATWDLNIVDADGLAVRFDKLNLIDVAKVTLKEADGKVIAEVE